MWRLWMSQSCFPLGFLSQYSLWKLSTFRGYKGYLYWGENEMRRVRFFKTELAGGLDSWLDWAASSSHEVTERPVCIFCPVVLQLAWFFNFWHAWHVFNIWRLTAASHLRDQIVSPCFFALSWVFLHTLSLTTLTWIPPKYRVTNS